MVSNRRERPDIRPLRDGQMQRTPDETALGIQIPRFTVDETAVARYLMAAASQRIMLSEFIVGTLHKKVVAKTNHTLRSISCEKSYLR